MVQLTTLNMILIELFSSPNCDKLFKLPPPCAVNSNNQLLALITSFTSVKPTAVKADFILGDLGSFCPLQRLQYAHTMEGSLLKVWDLVSHLSLPVRT